MLKAAFAYWNNRIAQVFDLAQQIHLVGVDSGRVIEQRQEIFPHDLPSCSGLVNSLIGAAFVAES